MRNVERARHEVPGRDGDGRIEDADRHQDIGSHLALMHTREVVHVLDDNAVYAALDVRIGLGHGTVVRIAGLDGEYRVLDKMARRWERKIDIYMGVDAEAARRWGKRRVTLSWVPEAP